MTWLIGFSYVWSISVILIMLINMFVIRSPIIHDTIPSGLIISVILAILSAIQWWFKNPTQRERLVNFCYRLVWVIAFSIAIGLCLSGR